MRLDMEKLLLSKWRSESVLVGLGADMGVVGITRVVDAAAAFVSVLVALSLLAVGSWDQLHRASWKLVGVTMQFCRRVRQREHGFPLSHLALAEIHD